MPARSPTHLPSVTIMMLSEEQAICCEAFDCAVYCILPSLPPSYTTGVLLKILSGTKLHRRKTEQPHTQIQ
jgi:hypothetical protein